MSRERRPRRAGDRFAARFRLIRKERARRLAGRSEDLQRNTESRAHEGADADMELGPLPGRRRIGLAGRCALGAAALLLALLASGAFLIWTIQNERNSAFLRNQFVALLSAGLGPENRFALDSAGLKLAGITPTFSIGGLSIHNPETGAAAELDRADVRLTRASVLRLAPEAKSIRFEGLRLVLPGRAGTAEPPGARAAMALLRAVLAGIHGAIAGQDPAFAALTTIEGRDITILRRAEDGSMVLVRSGLTASFTRKDDAHLVASLGRQGEAAAVTLAARAAPSAEGGRVIELESGGLTAATLFQFLSAVPAGIDPALRLVARVTARVDEANRPLDTMLTLVAAGGRIVPPDPDMLPFDLDEARIDLRLAPDEADMVIDRAAIRFGETEIVTRGRLGPGGDGAEGLKLDLVAERLVLGRLSRQEPLVTLPEARLEGRIAPDGRTFDLDRLAFGDGTGSGLLSGRFSMADGGLVDLRFEAQGFDLRPALRVWPIWIAPAVRTWLVDRVEGGRVAALSVQSRLAGESLRAAQEKRPIPNDSLRLTYRLEDVTLKPLDDALPVRGLVAEGLSTGRRAAISLLAGRIEPRPGASVEIQRSELVVADTAQRPALLEMNLPLRGHLGAFMTYLSAPSLRSVTGVPSDIEIRSGQFEGRAAIRLPLTAQAASKDVRVEFRADLRQVAIDNVVKDERIEDGQFQLVSRNGQIQLRGEAKLFGTTQQIEIRGEAGKAPRAVLKSVLDEAQLARRGIEVKPILSGPVAATVSLDLDGRPARDVEIELDLARARVEGGLPGLSKRAGQPGRVKFVLQTRQDLTILDHLDFEMGGVSARGRLEFQRGGFHRAEFAALKLSPGDNVRVTAERVKTLTKIVVRGNSFDLRPFLKSLQAGRIEEARGQAGKAQDGKSQDGADLDLDLETTVLVGFNGELMSGVSARAQKRQGRLAQLNLQGRFGAAPIAVTTLEQRADATRLGVEGGDAGSLFRFLDLYTRAYGGRMNADLTIAADRQTGLVQVRDFDVRGEPGLKQASGSVAAAQPDRQFVAGSTGDVVRFEKLRAEFTRRPGRLDVPEAVMWGASIGGSIEGTIDYARDTVSLKGAFVPAYALNNLFAQVPIIGRILGGGQYEGLFAVPFVITGKASAPVLRINPVSAIAPGFLRKFFEIQREK